MTSSFLFRLAGQPLDICLSAFSFSGAGIADVTVTAVMNKK